MDKEDIQGQDSVCNCLHSLESAIECTCFDKDDDEMKFTKLIDKLRKKGVTDQEIWNLRNLNHCKNCKYKKQAELFTIDSKLPDDYYGSDKYNEE